MAEGSGTIVSEGNTFLNAGEIFAAQQAFFKTGITRSYAFRKGQLNVLRQAIVRHETQIFEALKKDLHKSAFESFETELAVVYQELNFAIRHLREWMQPERVASPLVLFPSVSTIYPDPLGTVLIISPWNYPLHLILAPLIGAIAGGNTVFLKPSEEAQETAKVVTLLIEETFEPDYICVLNGPGKEVIMPLMKTHRFDLIFFTGSRAVGQRLMAAAAEKLTPVTLELGGKCPCIVASDASINYTAKRLAWGKWINAGQTCVAPDYLLVHESVKEKLLEKLKQETVKMFGEDARQSPDYPRIISKKHWDVLAGYLQEANIIWGGEKDRTGLYISPTLVEAIDAASTIMKEELFGPILPVVTFLSLEEAVQSVERNPFPLAMYVFTESKKTARYFFDNIRAGGGCINNTLLHLGNPALPFGGVGLSGFGKYHGKAGFDCFTSRKSVVKSRSWFDISIWYAPFTDHLKYLRKLIR